MKNTRIFLLVLQLLVLLGGCSEMSQEDRDFYGRGWIHPGELDQERPTKMPAHPETTGSLGPAPVASNGGPVSGNAVPSSDGTEWTPPQ